MIESLLSTTAARHRFFFGLRPPARLAHGIAALSDGMAGGGYRLTAERLHLTIAITEDYEDWPGALVEAMLQVGERIALAPIEVRLDRLVQGSRSVLLVPGPSQPGLRAFSHALTEGMAAVRMPLRKGTSFSPHMTLFYRNGAPMDRRVAGFAWSAGEFELIHSRLGRGEHRTLRRWPLRGVEPSQFALF